MDLYCIIIFILISKSCVKFHVQQSAKLLCILPHSFCQYVCTFWNLSVKKSRLKEISTRIYSSRMRTVAISWVGVSAREVSAHTSPFPPADTPRQTPPPGRHPGQMSPWAHNPPTLHPLYITPPLHHTALPCGQTYACEYNRV